MHARAARLIYHTRREFRRFGQTAVYFDSTRGTRTRTYGVTPSCTPTATSPSSMPRQATSTCGCRVTASRSSPACSATWSSSWTGNARGPGPTTSAVMTRWWIPARHGPITTAGTRSTPHPPVTLHPESRPRAQLPGPGLRCRPHRHRAAPGGPRHHPGQPARRHARGSGSQPVTIAFPAADAITRTLARARTVLRGPELRKIRLDHPDLQSPDPDRDTPSDGAAPHSHRCGC